MRIALVHPYSWPAVRRGGERYVHDLARWLADRGHAVDLLTGGSATHVDESGVRTVGLPAGVPARWAACGVTPLDLFGAQVLPRLLRERYDVVHSLIPSGGLAGSLALLPSVWTALGHPSPTNAPQRRWSRLLLRRSVAAVRVPAALSRSAADGLEALTGRRAVVLPPGVRTADFPVRSAAATGPPRLLFPAYAADPRKRLHVLLAALPAVLEQRPDTRLVLGGGGDPSAAFDRLEAGVRRVVAPHVDDLGTGALTDLPARYRAASLTVLPSVDEAFGLVLVESLASGTPVVCTRSGGMPEIVDETVGRLHAPDDTAALARAILQTLATAVDPDVCAERAQRWDWAHVGRLHELAYARARG